MPEQVFCCITFHSVHLALRFEQLAKEAGVAIKLIPVPRQISASCGISGRFEPELTEQVEQLCTARELEFEAIYQIKGKESVLLRENG